MKILISESQLQTITLNEVQLKDGVREIYQDNNVVVSTIDGGELDQKFRGFVQVKNLTNQYMTIVVEKGNQWGNRGEEEEIKYDKAPIKSNSYSNISFIIDPNKQNEGGYNKTNFNLTYFIKGNRKTINVNYGWFSAGKKNSINKCKTDRGYDKLIKKLKTNLTHIIQYWMILNWNMFMIEINPIQHMLDLHYYKLKVDIIFL